MKKQRVMSAMVFKETQNHKIAVRLSLVLVFFISFMSVYIFRALLVNDNAAASGYLSATGAMLVGLSVAFMTDRAAFGESVKRFDDDAGETIRSATYLFLVLSDLLTRIGIIREQALRRTLRSDVGEYLLSGHRPIFEIGAYKTIQGQKIGVISDIGEHVHVVYDLVNIFDGSGNFKKITEDRSRLIVDACERLGAQIDSLRTELMKFRFSLDLGQDYQKEHNSPPSSA